MLLNFSVLECKHLDIIGGQGEKQTSCNNLLELMTSAEELQIKLSKYDLQFSAQCETKIHFGFSICFL